MAVWRRSHKNQGTKAKTRRSSSLARLENQTKHFNDWDGLIPLFSEPQKKRIKREIETLKTRI